MTREDMPPIIIAKKTAAEAASRLIQNGMILGLGTGSTTAFFIEYLGRRCKEENLQIQAICSSQNSFKQAKQLGIPLLDEQTIVHLDMTFDGADEIDHQKNMIKGGGGALLREKLIAKSCNEMVVMVDENKLVDQLGAHPVAVEISAFLYRTTLLRLEKAGYKGELRLNRDQSIYVTDNGNYIFDIQFDNFIINPEKEEKLLKEIVGIIDTGLFYKVAGRVVVGYQDGFAKVT